MNSVRQSILRRDLGVLALYVVLVVVFTYPLILYFDSFGPGHGVDDPAQTWNLWWTRFAIFDLATSPLTTDYLFYPLGLNLVAYTPTFLNGILSIPLQFAFGVVVAQNLIVLFSLVAGGYGAFLFTNEILCSATKTHRHEGKNLVSSCLGGKLSIGAVIAGAVYAFGAWHINYVVAGHFMLLSNEWLPFFALCLIRWDKSRWSNGALAGLFFVMTTWTELTFAPFLAIFTLLYLVYRLLSLMSLRGAKRRSNPQLPTEITSSHALRVPRHDIRRIFSNLIAMGVVSLIGISPLVANLVADIQRYGYYLTSGVGRIQIFSAEPISFFFPSSQHPILGAWANSLTNANTSYAFIGYAALILAVIGFFASRASRFWAVAAIFFALLMLGSTLIVGSQNTGIPLPFALLRQIPLVNANRYPARFNVMLMLALVPLIAFGAEKLLQAQRGKLILGALTALLAFEQLVIPIPLSDMRVPSVFQSIRNEPGDFSILEIPIGWRGSISLQGKMDDHAQFFQTIHHKRLLGGITSRIPSFKFQYFLETPVLNSLIALEQGREVDDSRRALDQAAAPYVQQFFDIRYVDVNRELTDDAVMQYVRSMFKLTEIYRDDTHTVYCVGDLPEQLNTKIEVGAEPTNLYFDDRWGRVQYLGDGSGYRWAAQNESALWLPLEQQTQTIHFRLRGNRAGQNLIVRVNKSNVATLTLSDNWQEYAVSMPASVLRDGLDEIIFVSDATPVDATRLDNYYIGDTGIVSPVDISATGAGYDAGRYGELWVAGKNRIESKRGYHLVAIQPQTGAIDRIGLFDTFADAKESARLAQFIADLPSGEIVAGVAIDDVSQNLKPVAIDALHSIGVDGDLRFQFRAGQAFIGVKARSVQPGQAVERVDGRFPANVSVGKNVASDRAAFALGRITIGEKSNER
ncbi:MAG: hypothetical protein HZB51_09700 [Chloroflexi bacterium]|nr:hypothetical protein [Chloroflexota bacterium]